MSRVIDAVLRLRDEFTSPLEKSIKSMTRADKVGRQTRKSIQKMGETISAVGTGLTAAITVPLATLATTAVTEFGEVDESLKLVQATMGSTTEEAESLESAIKTAAANSVYGMQDAADATLNFARQGFDAAKAADMISPALDLAAGTATDLSTVTSGLGNALKMFGEDSSYATKAADILATAQAQANTTVSDLFEAMSTAGPMLNSVGWSMSDLATLTDVFGDAGISGSEGATALKTGIARLASPSSDAAGWMEKLGINIFNADGSMKEMVDVQEQLHNAFAGLTAEEKTQAASSIFGKNQMAKWLTLIEAAPETVQGYSDALEEASGTSETMADSLLSGVGGSIEKLKSSFDVLKYSVGDLLADYVQPFIDKITSLIDTFNHMDEAQQKAILKYAAIAAAIGPCLIAVGKLIVGFSKFLGVISKLRAAFSAVSGGFKVIKVAIAAVSSPIGIVIAMLAAVALVVVAVVRHFDEFKAAAGKLAENVSPSVEKLKEAFTKLWETVKPVIEKLSDLFATALVGAIEGAADTISLVIDGIVAVIEGITSVIQGVVDVVKGIMNGDWSEVWNGMKEIVSGVFTTISGIIKGVVGTVEKLVSAISGAIDKLKGLKDAMPAGTTVTYNADGTIKQNASGTPNWQGGWTQVNEKGGEIMNLPNGTQIIPHDASRNTPVATGGISIAKLADSIIVREDADIEKIANALAKKLRSVSENTGGSSLEYSY